MLTIPKQIKAGYFVKIKDKDQILKIASIHWSLKHFMVWGYPKAFKWCQVEKWYKKVNEVI